MTHIKGYTKHDGTIVKPHDDKRQKHDSMGQIAKDWARKHVPNLVGLFDEKDGQEPGSVDNKPIGDPHPELDEKGKTVYIRKPSTPTSESTWDDPKQIATFTPGGSTPKELNGVPFQPWDDAPDTPEDWDEVEGQDESLKEPPFDPGELQPAAGVVVEEPDGRVWVIHPTNGFGGYKSTFPKGRAEHDINLQASAIKEAYEESGLKVEITGFLADVDRSVTRARYYTAKRVGGTPAKMGWESQAVSLVPRSKLYEALNNWNDHPMAEKLGAGPQPPRPKSLVADKPYLFQKPTYGGSAPKSQAPQQPAQGKPSGMPPVKLVKKPS